MSCRCGAITTTKNKISELEEELKLWEQDEKTLEEMKKDIESCNISVEGIVSRFLSVASYSYLDYEVVTFDEE